MLTKIKEYGLLIIALLLICMLALQLQKCQGDKDQRAALVKLDQNLTALDDSIKKKLNQNGDTVFSERSVDMSIDDLVKTSFFKQMSKEKQQYYLDLQKTSGLLAASYEVIHKQDSLLASLKYNVGTKNDSGVCFKYGDTLDIPKDTVNRFVYEGGLMFRKDAPKLALKYSYQTKLSSKYIRNKDGSVSIEHQLDDPNASIIEGQSYIVPAPKLTKWEKFKRGFNVTLKVGGGAAVGYVIGRATK